MTYKLLTTWDEINKELIHKYIIPKRGGNDDCIVNMVKSYKNLYSDINNKLKSKLYQNLDETSAINTIGYIFFEVRAGVFVSIRNNRLEAFIPFANANYKNKWSSNLKLGPRNVSVREFNNQRRSDLGYTKPMLPVNKWWANQHFVNTEPREDVWGVHSLDEYKDMIETTLLKREVGNCMFILNKRDHPLMLKSLNNPYSFISDQPISHPKSSYIPILSPYTNDNYLDITIPVAQDWQLASKPETYYQIVHDVDWDYKWNIAFFRGAATGRVDIKHNQRLMISKMKSKLLDAGVTSWNTINKVDHDKVIRYIIPKEMNKKGIYLKPRVNMEEQLKYKYLINIDGHTRTNRTSWILKSSSLMLLVEPMMGSGHAAMDKTWIDNIIKPYEHYIPIKSDLSDLESQIKWCIDNDSKCKCMVKKANLLSELYFNVDTITEYMAYTFNSINNKNKNK